MGGGTGGLKKIVSAPQFGLKIRGGWVPEAPSLDPSLLTTP